MSSSPDPSKRGLDAAAVLDGFFEVAPLGMVVLDDRFRIVKVNQAVPRRTGRDPNDFLGVALTDIPTIPPEIFGPLEKVRDTRERASMEFSLPLGDGVTGTWMLTFFPIDLQDGSFLIGVIVRDITRRRRGEQAVQEALAAAEEANRSKDQFIARVSHELRSPLQVALSSAEVLKRMPDLPQNARKFVDRLGHAVAMQARMINDLLDVSRILSGKLHVAMEAVDPALPLLNIIEHWSTIAQERGITLDASAVHPGRGLVEADAARLEQVYANLLDNAIRFSADGGLVQVGTYPSPSHWRLSVRDFGAGMTQDEMHRVFEPFTQGSSQPRSGKGLGLGLAIVRSLVDAFGGRVWAESAGRDKGCTFIVELPLLPADSEPTSGFGSEASSPRLDGLSILYVDDEADVAQAMFLGLSSLGANVIAASSFDDALRAMHEQPLDVVVTDLNLGPGPGGEAVAQALHGIPRHALVPIVAVSAFGTQTDIASTAKAGFAVHLVKPVDLATVAQVVRRVSMR